MLPEEIANIPGKVILSFNWQICGGSLFSTGIVGAELHVLRRIHVHFIFVVGHYEALE
jgi:hypothetical protein